MPVARRFVALLVSLAGASAFSVPIARGQMPLIAHQRAPLTTQRASAPQASAAATSMIVVATPIIRSLFSLTILPTCLLAVRLLIRLVVNPVHAQADDDACEEAGENNWNWFDRFVDSELRTVLAASRPGSLDW